ncbi:MAG TPA: META domain-containing protein [Burkholderiales bacterium]|nr:META domain-containing protein [Burkholderiales bacterium]
MSMNRVCGIVLLLSACFAGGCAEWEKVLDSLSDEPVENTYWKLTQLNGMVVVATQRQREAHFVLHHESGRMTGSGGCNGISGTYKLEGDRLSFGPLAGTMMSCGDGMETERNFLGALQKGGRARVASQQLELLDSSGGVAARFDAIYNK